MKLTDIIEKLRGQGNAMVCTLEPAWCREAAAVLLAEWKRVTNDARKAAAFTTARPSHWALQFDVSACRDCGEFRGHGHECDAGAILKHAAWSKFLQAVMAFLDAADQGSPIVMRALADAACEYTGKRVERHVAEEREACAQIAADYAITARPIGENYERAIARHIRARGEVKP